MDELTNPEGTGFTPIGYATGSENISFNGTFDGNENTISNLYIKNNIASKSVGLFGKISNSTIKNLKLTGNVITTANANMGGIVGRVYGDSTIQNIEGTVNMESEVTTGSTGGIIGSTSDANGTYILKDLINRGSITEGRNNGGIIGWVMDKKMTIENCQNYGTIKNGERVGGIVGGTDNSSILVEINNSHNYGQIKIENNESTNVAYIGGLMGLMVGTLTIEESSNEIEKTNESEGIIIISTGSKRVYAGGLVGRAQNYSMLTIENSYNTSDIKGGTHVGGILGESTVAKLIMNKCYNTGNLILSEIGFSAGLIFGGLSSGFWDSQNVYIINSYNTGNIIRNNINNSIRDIGLIGFINNDTGTNSTKSYVINSYNLGHLSSNNFSSGIADVISSCNITINNVYNLGNLEGTTKYGILRSTTTGTVDVKNAYYLTGVNGSNVSSNGSNLSIDTKSMNENEIKSQIFVDTLNSNINNIDLGSIDSELSNYKLEQWILGSGGYPTLNYNLEGNE